MNNLTKANHKTWAVFGIVTLIAVAAIALFCVGNSFAVEGEDTGSAATAAQVDGAASSAAADAAAPASEKVTTPAEEAADASEQATEAADEEDVDPDAEGDKTAADKAANEANLDDSSQELESDGETPSNAVEVWYKYDGTTLHLASTGISTDYTKSSDEQHGWTAQATAANCTSVILDDKITPNVTARWFVSFLNLPSLSLSNLITSNVTDMSNMFNNCSSLTSINISGIDTSKVTNMSNMFENCSSLTSINISGIDTSKVTNMSKMFSSCTGLTNVDISSLNTNKVTNMSYMFASCSGLTNLEVSNFNTSEVTDMSGMFASCSGLTNLEVSNFNTSEVTDMSGMFGYCTSLTELNTTNFDTTKVTNFAYMFYGCTALTSIDISTFNKAGMTEALEAGNSASVGSMFNGCSSLTTIKATDNFDLAYISGSKFSSEDMFTDCTSLKGGEGTLYSEMHTNAEYAHIDGKDYMSGYFTGEVKGRLFYKYDADNTLHISGNKIDDTYTKTTDEDHDWTDSGKSSCTKVVFDNACSPTTTAEWFNQFEALESFESLENLDTTNVTNMSSMFMYCENILTLDVGNFNTSSVTDTSYMFSGCKKLSSLDLTKFDTSSVTNMNYMFQNCESLTDLDLKSFNTNNVTTMSGMFSYCNKLANIDLSSVTTGKVTDMSAMFSNSGSLTSINLSNFDTSSVIMMYKMFENCTSLTSLDLTKFDTSNVAYAYYMFSGCTSLTNVNLSNFNTSKMQNFSSMFKNCSALTNIDISTFNKAKMAEELEGSGYASVGSMFEGCTSLITIKATDNFDLTELFSKYTTTFTSTDMFKGCNNLVGGAGTKYVSSKDNAEYAHLDGVGGNPGYFTGEPEGDLFYKFDADYTLHISGKKLDSDYKATTAEEHAWQEGSVHSVCATVIFDNEIAPTTTVEWFRNFNVLTTFQNLPNLNTSNVTSMEKMFAQCYALESINLSAFNTSNVTDMNNMFNSAGITSIDLSGFDTSKVEVMYYMFAHCDALTSVNLSGFDTSKVKDFSGMFAECKSLTSIDISTFDTSGLVKCVQEGENGNTSYIFQDCENLTTIHASDKFDISSLILQESEKFNSKDMFKGSTKLVGGAGTTYDASVYDEALSNDPYPINDAKYAHIDGGSANPGYFTGSPAPSPEPTPTPGDDTGSAVTGSSTGSTGDSIPFALLAAFAVVAAVAAGAVVYARKCSK